MRKIILTVWLLLLAACGAAETALPGFDDFSPGYRCLSGRIASGETVAAETVIAPEAAFYIRDVSVLSDLFSGLVIETRTGTDADAQTTVMTLRDGGQTLETAALRTAGEETLLSLGGRTLRLPPEWLRSAVPHGIPDALGITDFSLPEMPAIGLTRFARMPLEELAALIGDGGLGGVACEAESAADGGLSRLTLSGQLPTGLLPGDGPWTVEGTLSRGSGKAPRDTAELAFSCGEGNALTLTCSTQYKATEAKKDRQGTLTRTTRARLSGKVGGNGVSFDLSLKEKNAWRLEDGVLSEKITVSTKLDWQDRTPEHSALRLGNGNVTAEETFAVTSTEGEADAWTDETSLKLYMTGDKALASRITIAARLGGDAPAFPSAGAEAADGGVLMQELRSAGARIAQRLYSRLGKKSQGTITKGL